MASMRGRWYAFDASGHTLTAARPRAGFLTRPSDWPRAMVRPRTHVLTAGLAHTCRKAKL